MENLSKHSCPQCLQEFTTLRRLQSHLDKKIPCTKTKIKLKSSNQIRCQFCNKEFARKDNLIAHVKKNRCVILNYKSENQSAIMIDQKYLRI